MESKVEKIFSDNNGIVTANQLREKNISYTIINKMVENNKIRKVDRGLYINNDDYYADDWFIFQKKHPEAIFSHNNALYIFDMTERAPHQMEITVRRNYHIIPKNNEFVLFRVPDDIYELGITTGKTICGNEVKCYNLERTVIDIIFSNKTLDTESRNKAVRWCIRNQKFNGNLMFEYAKKMKVYDKLQMIIDVII